MDFNASDSLGDTVEISYTGTITSIDLTSDYVSIAYDNSTHILTVTLLQHAMEYSAYATVYGSNSSAKLHITVSNASDIEEDF